jgi:O-antigen ligase
LAMYLFAVAVYMGHSLWEYHNGRYQWRQGTTRMIGVDITYGDPNAFASTLVYTLPLTLPFWWGRPRPSVRALLVGFTGLAGLCILLTGSRAGFIGLCAAGFLALVTGASRKGRAILLCGGAALAGLLVLAVALPEDLQNRYLTLIDSDYGPRNAEVSASGRLAGFVEGIAAWQRSPLLGHGPAAFAMATGREGQAHNLYGQTLSEVGLLGALALCGLLYCFWRNTVEARRLRKALPSTTPPFAALVSWAVGLTVVLLLLMGWAGHNLYRYNWQWFAAFQAIALHCLRTRALAWNARRVPYRSWSRGYAAPGAA